MKRTNLLIYLTLALVTGFFGADVEFKASISADKIGIDDFLEYTVKIKGDNNPIQP